MLENVFQQVVQHRFAGLDNLLQAVSVVLAQSSIYVICQVIEKYHVAASTLW